MHFGTIVIDWAARKVTWYGLDGGNMKASTVLSQLAYYNALPDYEAWALIYWDDEHQLCVHDATGFKEEISA